MKGKVAGIIFINNKKEILLYLRDNKPNIPYPNTWAMLGGHVEANETILEALKREIREEIGYFLEKAVFINSFDDGAGNRLYVHKSFIDKNSEELTLTEGQKLGFFSFEDVLKINLPKPFLNFILQNKDKIFESIE